MSFKLNSKGKVIEELDTEVIEMRGPFQSPKPSSPKREKVISYFTSDQINEAEILAWSDYYLASKRETTNYGAISNICDKLEAEILAWSEAYLASKKQN